MSKMTEAELVALAQRVLGAHYVGIDENSGFWENVAIFEATPIGPKLYVQRHLLIDPFTQRYKILPHNEPDGYFEDLGDFAAGMQFSHYRLSVTEIRHWPRTQYLFRCLGLDVVATPPPTKPVELMFYEYMGIRPFVVENNVINAQSFTHWSEIPLAVIEAALAAEPLVFHLVDGNGILQDLCAATYFDCFRWQLRGLDRETDSTWKRSF